MEVLLFPLVNVTLFPKTTKPLNVFESRYLRMVKDSIESMLPIAIGFMDDAHHMSAQTVGSPVVGIRPLAGFGPAQIIEERSNGTLLIFIQGQGKVRLEKILEDRGEYFLVQAQLIQEDDNIDLEERTQLADLLRILTRWIKSHISDPVQQDLFLRNVTGPEEIVGAFGSYLVRDYDLQQMVFEFDNMNEKIRFLYRLVESAEVTA